MKACASRASSYDCVAAGLCASGCRRRNGRHGGRPLQFSAHARGRAFTLIETLVVVAIVALLAAILLPALSNAREQGRRAVCLSNLKQLSFATAMYLDQNREYFWRYYTTSQTPRGRRWWFGFEPNGPDTSRPRRPLDKRQGVLARDLASTDDGLQCPSFPYADGAYFPKFAARGASYGYNLTLGPANPALPTRRRSDYSRQLADVFVFADGIHFDFNPGFNEGHYIEYVEDPSDPYALGGYGHFRHNRRANALYLDGHATGQPLRESAYAVQPPGGPAGNLTSPAGSRSVYGQ